MIEVLRPVTPRRPWRHAQVIVAKPNQIALARALDALLVAPLGVLPNAEGDPVRVFAVGIHTAMVARRRPEVDDATVSKALRAYVRSFAYRLALAQPGSMRHDIDGIPVDEVRDIDRLEAQEQCEAFTSRLKRRRAASQAVAPMQKPMPEVAMAE